MPFTGTATVVQHRHYKHPVSGRTFSFFSGWVEPGSELIERGFDISWSDGTVGRCKPPFETEAEAITFAGNWNTDRAARYAAAGQEDPYATV